MLPPLPCLTTGPTPTSTNASTLPPTNCGTSLQPTHVRGGVHSTAVASANTKNSTVNVPKGIWVDVYNKWINLPDMDGHCKNVDLVEGSWLVEELKDLGRKYLVSL